MMLRPRLPIAANAPEALPEKQREDREEDSRNFMPQRTHRVSKRLPEPAPKSHSATRYAARYAPGRRSWIRRSALLGWFYLRTRRSLGLNRGPNLSGPRSRGRGGRCILRPLAQNLRGHPRADPQLAS